jgi:hypothetical protein
LPQLMPDTCRAGGDGVADHASHSRWQACECADPPDGR